MTRAAGFGVSEQLAYFCTFTPERGAWLERLPETIREFERRWSLIPGTPFTGDTVTCAWVSTVMRADGSPAVLKIAMPHMEAEQEIEGLRFWNGEPTVRLFEADDEAGAMLLERCQPGTRLREEPVAQQDVVIAGLLRRLWRAPAQPDRFRTLAEMLQHWSEETLQTQGRLADPALVHAGLELFAELPRTAREQRVLFTDLHAGNVLRAQREPWLAIDPKPFAGDPAYDATQHLFIDEQRLLADPLGTIRRFADLLELDAERVRLWMFARAAAEPRTDWRGWKTELARAIAP